MKVIYFVPSGYKPTVATIIIFGKIVLYYIYYLNYVFKYPSYPNNVGAFLLKNNHFAKINCCDKRPMKNICIYIDRDQLTSYDTQLSQSLTKNTL